MQSKWICWDFPRSIKNSSSTWIVLETEADYKDNWLLIDPIFLVYYGPLDELCCPRFNLYLITQRTIGLFLWLNLPRSTELFIYCNTLCGHRKRGLCIVPRTTVIPHQMAIKTDNWIRKSTVRRMMIICATQRAVNSNWKLLISADRFPIINAYCSCDWSR